MDNEKKTTSSLPNGNLSSIEEMVKFCLEYYGLPGLHIEDDKILDEDGQVIVIMEHDEINHVKIFTFVRIGRVIRIHD